MKNTKMNVLFLMLELPANLSSSNLYLDLALEFKAQNHEIYIIAPAVGTQKTGLYEERGLKVLRVETLNERTVKSILKKGFAQLILPYQYLSAYKKYIKDVAFDLILMPTPPITFTNLVLHIKKRTNAAFYLILRDIYPQGAADIGLVRFRFIYYYLRKLERLTYKKADIIGCMSPGNIDYIREHNSYIDAGKLVLLPNWQAKYDFESLTTNVREKYQLEDKYIVLFGGTIGYAQKVDNIVVLAEQYRGNKEILFLVIGNGSMKRYLQDKVVEKQLDNVMFMDGLPRDEYLNFVKSSDIGLITIDERFTVPTIPSKTTSYFNLKLPVLAIIDKHTDYGKIIDEAGAGLWSVGGDHENLFSNFDRLFQSKALRLQLGENGYKYFVNNWTSELAYQNIMSHLKQLK